VSVVAKAGTRSRQVRSEEVSRSTYFDGLSITIF
jgi:hypothetical protein